ncbi:hypothetical protein U8V97_20610 [Priestia filamentosa]|uniref:hypothetical protein n=1 Tax=Priestia filamentosa TaxID=1402861 RepID=UPI001FB26230|nr:hypothetical protein [Priestia filamentosa]
MEAYEQHRNILKHLISTIGNRSFLKNKQLKFWLRMSFFLPAHLAKAIEKEVTNIEEKVQPILESKFQDWINAKVIVEDAIKTPTFAS